MAYLAADVVHADAAVEWEANLDIRAGAAEVALDTHVAVVVDLVAAALVPVVATSVAAAVDSAVAAVANSSVERNEAVADAVAEVASATHHAVAAADSASLEVSSANSRVALVAAVCSASAKDARLNTLQSYLTRLRLWQSISADAATAGSTSTTLLVPSTEMLECKVAFQTFSLADITEALPFLMLEFKPTETQVLLQSVVAATSLT